MRKTLTESIKSLDDRALQCQQNIASAKASVTSLFLLSDNKCIRLAETERVPAEKSEGGGEQSARDGATSETGDVSSRVHIPQHSLAPLLVIHMRAHDL